MSKSRFPYNLTVVRFLTKIELLSQCARAFEMIQPRAFLPFIISPLFCCISFPRSEVQFLQQLRGVVEKDGIFTKILLLQYLIGSLIQGVPTSFWTTLHAFQCLLDHPVIYERTCRYSTNFVLKWKNKERIKFQKNIPKVTFIFH